MGLSRFKLHNEAKKYNRRNFDKINNKPLSRGMAKYDRIDKSHKAVKVGFNFKTNTNRLITLTENSWDKAKISNVGFKFFYGQPKRLI